MNQLLYFNRIYPFLPITKLYNSSSNPDTLFNSSQLINYTPNSYHYAKNNYQNILTNLNQSRMLSTCIQHTPYSNLIYGNLEKPCTGVYCKYKKNTK